MSNKRFEQASIEAWSQKGNSPDLSILLLNVDIKDPRYEKYVELIKLMTMPVIEQIIFSKIEEIKKNIMNRANNINRDHEFKKIFGMTPGKFLKCTR